MMLLELELYHYGQRQSQLHFLYHPEVPSDAAEAGWHGHKTQQGFFSPVTLASGLLRHKFFMRAAAQAFRRPGRGSFSRWKGSSKGSSKER